MGLMLSGYRCIEKCAGWGGRVLLIAQLFIGIFFMNCSPSSAVENNPVVIVNGEQFGTADMEQALNVFLPAAAFHGGINDEMRAKYRDDAINFIIEQQLLYEAARTAGIKPDKKVVDAQIEKTIKRHGSKKELKKALKASGFSYDDFLGRLRKKATVDKFTEEQIRKKSVYSDSELKSHYDANIESFRRPAARYIWHILIGTSANADASEREQRRIFAEMVAGQAKGGGEFELLAEKYSTDDYRVKGGLLGLVHKGQLVVQVEDVAFSLKENEVAGPIETIYGFHIVKAGKLVEQGLISFEQAEKRLRKSLEEKRYAGIMAAVLDEQRKKAKITIIDKDVKAKPENVSN